MKPCSLVWSCIRRFCAGRSILGVRLSSGVPLTLPGVPAEESLRHNVYDKRSGSRVGIPSARGGFDGWLLVSHVAPSRLGNTAPSNPPALSEMPNQCPRHTSQNLRPASPPL